ncbi:MAG: class I tRNA ligase family protein [Candidatus Fimivicinus sp.]|nr:class I tRNA ligase family protein [Oscillospiraceae bacterium]MDY5592030.1 class I tRNA ligase family protein [Candidatus Fimivicinus sp.]
MGLFCWILERVRDTAAKAATLLGQYEIGQARHEIDALFWDDSCDHYIEIVKQRLYQPKKHGTHRASGRRNMRFITHCSVF